MDVIAANLLSKWYISFYDQLGQQLHAPTPLELFESVTTFCSFLYDRSPRIVRTYYKILNSIPLLNENDLMFMSALFGVLILYALFALVVMLTKTSWKLVIGYLKLSLLLSLARTCYLVMHKCLNSFMLDQPNITLTRNIINNTF
jgi:hypothetical protein